MTRTVRETPGVARLRSEEQRTRPGSSTRGILEAPADPDAPVPMMTESEARACVNAVNRHMDTARTMLLDLYEREGWRALGYESWRACVVAEFQQSQRYLYYQLEAARTEREICSIVQTADLPVPSLSEWHLRQIAELPSADRQEVALELARGNLGNRAIRNLVTERRSQRVRDARTTLLASALPPLDDFGRCWIDAAEASSLPAPYLGTDLFVTSPPYGIGLEGSDGSASLDWGEYLGFAQAWASELYANANADHGRLCLNVPLDRTKGSREPVYADWLQVLRQAGWRYESTIVWKEGNVSNHQARGSVASPNAPHAVAPVEMILVMYRGEWDRGEPKRPSDIRELDWIDWLSSTWTFAGEHRYRVGHMAPFPEELPRRCIQLFSFPGDVVGDPFVGSGTTAVVALKLGRLFRGSDINPECVALTQARVAKAMAA